MFTNEQRLNQHDSPFTFSDMIIISKLRVLILSSADFFSSKVHESLFFFKISFENPIIKVLNGLGPDRASVLICVSKLLEKKKGAARKERVKSPSFYCSYYYF